MNTSTIYNMLSSQKSRVFISPQCTVWLTIRSGRFCLRCSSSLVRALTDVSSSSPHLAATQPPSPLSPIRTAVGSSGCETCRRRLPTYYSRPAADWIGVTIVDRDRFGSCRPPPPVLCSASIGSVLLYTGPARLRLWHRLNIFHSARSHGDTQSPRSCPAPGGGC
jgi:hypothetical protein